MFTFAIVTYKLPIGEVGIVVALLGLLVQPTPLRVPSLVWLYGGFVLWSFVASFASPFPDVAQSTIVEQAKLALVMLVAVNALQTKAQLRVYLLWFLACFTLFPARGTLISYARGSHPFGRAVWNFIYNNSNDLAALSLLAFGVALAIALAESERKAVRVAAGVAGSLFLTVILLTQSRGVFIGLVIATGPALIRSIIRRPSRLPYAAVAVIVLISLAPAGVWDRLAGITQLTSVATIASADPEGSAEQRWEIQKVAWRIFVDHPTFGIGAGAYRFANALYSRELGARDAHNTYLNVAAEVGWPGLALWLTLNISTLGLARRSRKQYGAAASGIEQVWVERATIGFLVAGAFGSYAKLSFPYLMLAILWCSAALAKEDAANQELRPRVEDGIPGVREKSAVEVRQLKT